MPLSIQAKLLRVIEENKILKVGDVKPIDINVRILAAMNEDPKEAISNGRLRKDLYYRFVGILRIPPVRERKDDIPLLVNYFIKKYSDKLGKNIITIKKNF